MATALSGGGNRRRWMQWHQCLKVGFAFGFFTARAVAKFATTAFTSSQHERSEFADPSLIRRRFQRLAIPLRPQEFETGRVARVER